MVSAPVRILITEYIPSLNKGELAILEGMLKSFGILGAVEVSVFSLNPKVDRTRYPRSVKAIDISRSLYLRSPFTSQPKAYLIWASVFAAFQHFLFMFLYSLFGTKALRIMDKPLWKAYCKYDVFIICHDEVDCVNGVLLQFSPIYISLLAKTLRKPVVVYANGTTKATNKIWIWRAQTKKLWRILARHLLSRVDLITVRDEETLLYYKEISSGAVAVYLTADPAFLLQPADQKTIEEIMMKEKIDKKGRPLIGLAITHEVLSEAFKNELSPVKSYERSIKEIAMVLDRLIDEYASTVIFIPHSVEPYRDDRIVAIDISNAMFNNHKSRVIMSEYSPKELKGLIGQLDLLISCRVHAAIGALSIGIPSVVIKRSLDRRAYNIIGKMVKQEKWIYDVEKLNADELFALVRDLLETSDEIRKDLSSIIDSVKERALLNGRLLKALLNSRLEMTKES